MILPRHRIASSRIPGAGRGPFLDEDVADADSGEAIVGFPWAGSLALSTRALAALQAG